MAKITPLNLDLEGSIHGVHRAAADSQCNDNEVKSMLPNASQASKNVVQAAWSPRKSGSKRYDIVYDNYHASAMPLLLAGVGTWAIENPLHPPASLHDLRDSLPCKQF